MATTPRERVEREKGRIETLADEGTITDDCADALAEYAVALDDAKVARKLRDEDGNVREYAPRTVEAYLRGLRITAESGLDLLSASADEFNAAIDMMHDDEGKAKTTLMPYQVAAKHFYRYHDLDADPDAIHVYSERSEPRHDETDIFSPDEVAALRRACGATGSPARNRALLELLIFTGQRITALLTLRVKDVELNPSGDTNTAYIYLNDDYDDEQGGLKGALARGRKRPIFGAKKYVRDWLQYHPDGDDPEAWLFIGDPSHWKTDPDMHLSEPSARQRLAQLAKEAEVDKPVNPHNFRHYCATVLKRDYDDVDNDDVRMLFGHVKGSSSLENTYQHLFDQDHIEHLETGMGYREPSEGESFTPGACPTCGELLDDGWRQCPNCQEVFGPTEKIESAAEQLNDSVTDAALGEDLSPEEREGLRALREITDDPEALYRRLAAIGGD